MNTQQLYNKHKTIPTYKKRTTKVSSLASTLKKIKKKITDKYYTDADTYSCKIINDIIYNEKSRIVARFKDFLIYDDLSDFFKRFYSMEESTVRIPKIVQYYETYSKIFPNYINLHEAKYIYKNIQKKQKMIDNQQKYEKRQKEQLRYPYEEEEKIFSTDIYESIMNTIETHPNLLESNKDLLDVQFNIDLCQNVNVFKVENSYLSLEKLIDNIGKAEKVTSITNFDDMDCKLETIISSPGEVAKSPPQALTYSKKENLNNPKNNINSGDSQAINKHTPLSSALMRVLSPRKQQLKTIETTSRSNNNFLINNQTSVLNKVLSNEKNYFEGNLLNKKFKELKEKNRMSTDTTNATGAKLKVDNTVSSSNNQLGISSVSKEKSKSNAVKPLEDRRIDSSKKKSTNSSVSVNKKTLSVPKLDNNNNIFYIINQNPQVNTQIYIYNNMDKNNNNNINEVALNNKHNNKHNNNNNPHTNLNINSHSGLNNNPHSGLHSNLTSNNIINHRNIKTARDKESLSPNTNQDSKMLFKLPTKNNFKKLTNLQPAMYNLLDKKKSSISKRIEKTIGENSNNNTNLINPMTLSSNSKIEKRDLTPSLTARQMMRTLSTFKSNILATIQNDEIKENNYLLNTIRDKITYPPKREKELTASERKIVTASSKIKDLATSRRLSRNKVNEGNHLSSPNNKLSIVDSTMLSKASHSPNKKPGVAANRENLNNFNNANNNINNNLKSLNSIYSHVHKKTYSNQQAELKSPNVFKPSQVNSKDQKNTNFETNPINKISATKFNPTKGFPIKNFSEAIKAGTGTVSNIINTGTGTSVPNSYTTIKSRVLNPNSDRTTMSKMDRLNKIK